VRVRSIGEAVPLLAEQACVLSGGTDLLVQLREGRRHATLVVDVKFIPELTELYYDPATGLHLGAAVPCYRINNDPEVAHLYPGLLDATTLVGGIQIQGRATVGGNLCNASPAADSIPALIVHGATCEIAGPAGRRRLPVEAFCAGPGQTVLGKGELLIELRLPPPAAHFGAAYLRFTPRSDMDIAVAGAAAAVQLDQAGTIIRSARVALGAVAPVPLLVSEAGAALAGQLPSAEAIEAAARLAEAAARPIDDVRGTAAQRKHLALVLTRRALQAAIARAQVNTLGRANGHV